MTPSLKVTYLALSRSGRIVQTFDSPSLLMAFIAKQKAKGVHLEPAVETTTRKPYVKQVEDTGIVNLDMRRERK